MSHLLLKATGIFIFIFGLQLLNIQLNFIIRTPDNTTQNQTYEPPNLGFSDDNNQGAGTR
ncbi:hypothetical protein NDI44_01325 [Trichocoleus sp. DQ-A3]|uniref:hypothetical protein n=1 Tax=Cyanophyceae TaxID=3028117 RepID=UPI001681CD54|nr:hypothetical protein [Coleofasciculus sp. FACHB-125]MBD1901496.1 hypothetical protein [Coleofasciculus sp. FACHB-125]